MNGVQLREVDLPDGFAEVVEVENEYAADVDDLRPDADDEGLEYGGGDVVFPGGFTELVDFVAIGLAPQLGVVVERVDHGVLKAGTIVFDPPLGDEKTGAIERLGMGLLNKVYLRFPEIFWDRDVEVFGYVGPELRRFLYWLNIAAYADEPVLLAFHGGTAAEDLEAMSDETIVAEAMQVLPQMFDQGSLSWPRPKLARRRAGLLLRCRGAGTPK